MSRFVATYSVGTRRLAVHAEGCKHATATPNRNAWALEANTLDDVRDELSRTGYLSSERWNGRRISDRSTAMNVCKCALDLHGWNVTIQRLAEGISK